MAAALPRAAAVLLPEAVPKEARSGTAAILLRLRLILITLTISLSPLQAAAASATAAIKTGATETTVSGLSSARRRLVFLGFLPSGRPI